MRHKIVFLFSFRSHNSQNKTKTPKTEWIYNLNQTASIINRNTYMQLPNVVCQPQKKNHPKTPHSIWLQKVGSFWENWCCDSYNVCTLFSKFALILSLVRTFKYQLSTHSVCHTLWNFYDETWGSNTFWMNGRKCSMKMQQHFKYKLLDNQVCNEYIWQKQSDINV